MNTLFLRDAVLAALLIGATGCTPHEARGVAPDVAQPSSSARTEVSMPSSPASLECPAALVAARRGGTDAARYVVPTDAERSAMRDLASWVATRGEGGRGPAATLAGSIGFELVDVPEIPGAVLLREEPSRRRGGGAYLVRLGSASKLVVQAPHTFFDEGTLPLACDLFARSGALALFIDTAHRYKAAEVDENGEHPADVAHAPSSLFQAATEGVLRAAPAWTVVQLHGFGERDPGTLVVVSNGERALGDPLVLRVAGALSGVTGGVRRFPEDTDDLGATTNVQGRAVRAAGARFLHVEMQAGLRRTLVSDVEARGRFFAALAGALGGG